MKIRHFSCWTYTSPTKDALEDPIWSIDYYLPFMVFNENKWNSKIVETLTILIWTPPYIIWFILSFLFQSIYMIPLFVYKGLYNCLKFLDKYLL